jgi:hypothetical protein
MFNSPSFALTMTDPQKERKLDRSFKLLASSHSLLEPAWLAGTLTAAAPAPVVPPAPPCAAQLPPDFTGIPLSFTFRSYRDMGPAA